MSLTIALDAMGGDHGPHVIVAAALEALADLDGVTLLLVGDQDAIDRELKKHKAAADARLRVRHASQQVAMDELPSQALRTKKDSSMRVAIDLVKNGTADACVSAGNTGALMATARFVLKTLPGIDRPAIISALPTLRGHTHMLDLGANVDSSSEQIFQFALMGSILTSAVDGVQRPTIGLLNVGAEEIKGNERVKEAARLLSESNLNYIGFVEGDDIYKGTVDVVVCDGFVGNVALKASEGVAHMLGQALRAQLNRNLYTRLVSLLMLPALRNFRRQFDPRQYNGASLVGLQGIVVKSHGSADTVAFACAIKEAALEVRKNVPELIRNQHESFLVGAQTV